MPQVHSVDDLLAVRSEIRSLFIPGASGEPTDLLTWLQSDPRHSDNLEITTSLVPGINRLEPEKLAPTSTLRTLFLHPGWSRSIGGAAIHALPMSYGGFVRYVTDQYQPDACAFTVSPPNAEGYCSFGVAAEFGSVVSRKARRKIALINERMPFVSNGERIHVNDIDVWYQTSLDLKTYDVGVPSAEATTIAGHVADLIEDGATLQLGLGKVPDALLSRLSDRHGLRFHSGMLSDGIIDLDVASALDGNWTHMACVLVGSNRLYDWAGTQNKVAIRGCDITHDPRRLSAINGFVAVNSALTVDLFGQCDLEIAGARFISGAGGAPDFARAARNAERGVSIVALPSTYAGSKGSSSRIVARLSDTNMVSIARQDVDAVVTEHGVADLRGKSVRERAEALISIADPSFQSDLRTAWGEINSTM